MLAEAACSAQSKKFAMLQLTPLAKHKAILKH